jgi:hypothetical protein
MKVGDEVKLLPHARKPNCSAAGPTPSKRTARIFCFLSDIPGGVRLTDRLNGFLYWNVEDLEKAN